MRVRVEFDVEIDEKEYPTKEIWFEAMIQDHLDNWGQEATGVKVEVLCDKDLPEMYEEFHERYELPEELLMKDCTIYRDGQNVALAGHAVNGKAIIMTYAEDLLVLTIEDLYTKVIQGEELERLEGAS